MHRSILLVILVICGYASNSLAQLTYKELFVDYDSAWQYKNLRIIPIRPKQPAGTGAEWSNTLSLNQALDLGLATLQERGTSSVENVHWLSLYNNSGKDILITSGEILSGGRQDRMVTKDTLLSGKTIRSDLAVMCVEEERWSKKSKKFTYEKKANSRLRKVLDVSGNQVLIWKEIDRQLQEDQVKNQTLSYLSVGRDKKFTPQLSDYLTFFKEKCQSPDSTMVGVICISGDQVIGTDIFAARNLFFDQLIPMLKGYIEEAVVSGAPVTLSDDKVKKYMDNILKDEKTQEEFVKKNGKLFKYKNKVVHLTTY
jgi:hypothetical protein